MGAHAVLQASCHVVERPLEAWVGERLDLAARVADEVMMMLAVDMRRLEAGDPVAQLDPLDELQLDELVERAVDAGDPDRPAVGANPVEDLLRRAAAGLLAQMLDHTPAGTPVAEPLRLQVVERQGAPGGVVLVHAANDTDSHYLLGCDDAFENRSL